jgi:hypothetical protein
MNSAALQTAIVTRLGAYAAFSSKVQAIYSESGVPQGADASDDSAFPYAVVGPFFQSPWDTDDTDGQSVRAQVHIYSRGKSDLVWRAICDAAYDALHKHDLVISGANTVDCLFIQQTSFSDPDGKTQRAVMEFRVTYDSI